MSCSRRCWTPVASSLQSDQSLSGSHNSCQVALESFNLNAARVPSSVTIPAAALSATFPIAAVNNEVVDGTKSATIQAYVTDTQTGARIAAATPDTINVLDDDGPTLRLVIDHERDG